MNSDHVFIVTFQLSTHISCCKYPTASKIPQIWSESMIPLITMIETAQQGTFILLN